MSFKSKDYMRVNCSHFVYKNGRIWTIQPLTRELIEVDITNRKAKIICKFNDLDRDNWFLPIYNRGNVFVAYPSGMNEILIYNESDNSVRFIDNSVWINDSMIKKEVSMSLLGSFFYDDSIYILGYTNPIIKKINIITGVTKEITGWHKKIDSLMNNVCTYEGYLGDGAIIIDQRKAVIPIHCRFGFLIMDLDTDEISYRFFEEKIDDGIRYILARLGYIWVFTKRGDILKLSESLDIIGEYSTGEIDSSYYYNRFHHPFFIDDRIVLPPMTGESWYEFNTNTGNIHSFLNELFDIKENGELLSYSAVGEFDNKIIMNRCSDNYWIIYDMSNDTIEEFEIPYPKYEDTIYEEMVKYTTKSGPIYEDGEGLKLLLGGLKWKKY